MMMTLYLLIGHLALTAGVIGAEFTFHGFSTSNLSLNGLAEITGNGLLQLTNQTKEGLGHGFYPYPINFKNSSGGGSISFSTTFVIAIVPQYADVCGHGMAFLLSPSTTLPGAKANVFLGFLSNATSSGDPSNHIIAVEFDTAKNSGDIDDNHVGIDVNSLVSVNSSSAAYFDGSTGNFSPLKLTKDQMQVWVDYNGTVGRLDVTVAPFRKPKPVKTLVSAYVDLSNLTVDNTYVGFSASTGSAWSSHYVLGWSFSWSSDATATLDLSKLPSLPRSHKKLPLLLIISLLLGSSTGLMILIATGVFIMMRIKKYSELKEDWEVEYGPHRISYREIYKATKGFSEVNVIGAGGFGRVYRGILPASRTEVAVKRISHNSRQGMREFVSEIASMSRLRHRNLVQLLGYCRREGELLLVYEFMANGSLDSFLFDGQRSAVVLSWQQRFRIIKDVAAGLFYLHEGWEQVVVHRDIKASNVLLDADMNGKLGDFGLARLYDHGTNSQTTHVVGTLGYLAPEISQTGKATTKTDVFAFGAFLLEVACGRRPMELNGAGHAPSLVDFVTEHWKLDRIAEARDPALGKDFDHQELELVLKLGIICSHSEPIARPRMRQLVQFLDDGDNVRLLPDKLPSDMICSPACYDMAFDDFVSSTASTSGITFYTQSSGISGPR